MSKSSNQSNCDCQSSKRKKSSSSSSSSSQKQSCACQNNNDSCKVSDAQALAFLKCNYRGRYVADVIPSNLAGILPFPFPSAGSGIESEILASIFPSIGCGGGDAASNVDNTIPGVSISAARLRAGVTVFTLTSTNGGCDVIDASTYDVQVTNLTNLFDLRSGLSGSSGSSGFLGAISAPRAVDAFDLPIAVSKGQNNSNLLQFNSVLKNQIIVFTRQFTYGDGSTSMADRAARIELVDQSFNIAITSKQNVFSA